MPGPNGFSGLLQGDWGWSFEYDKPVNEVVGDALWLTLLVNLAVVIFIHLVVDPDRHLLGDAAIFGRRLHRDLHRLYRARDAELPAGADPALLLNRWFGVSIGGLYDPHYAGAALDLAEDPVARSRTSSCRRS